jgi:threonine dehydrogenase-like Zn-dependent dehydrogenase
VKMGPKLLYTAGQFVIGSFFASDNTCPHCRAGYQTSCQHRKFVGGAQAPLLRVPLADGTLVATPGIPSDDLIPSVLALSDLNCAFTALDRNIFEGNTINDGRTIGCVRSTNSVSPKLS